MAFGDPTAATGTPGSASPAAPTQQKQGFMSILKNRILPMVGPMAARLGALYGNPQGLMNEQMMYERRMQQPGYQLEQQQVQDYPLRHQILAQQALTSGVTMGADEQGNPILGRMTPDEKGNPAFSPIRMAAAAGAQPDGSGAPDLLRPWLGLGKYFEGPERQDPNDPTKTLKSRYYQPNVPGSLPIEVANLSGSAAASAGAPVVDPGSATGFGTPMRNKFGAQERVDPGAPAPGQYVPTTTTTQREDVGTTPQGGTIMIPTQNVAQRTPNIPGVTPPAQGAQTSPAPTTPGNATQGAPPQVTPDPIRAAAEERIRQTIGAQAPPAAVPKAGSNAPKMSAPREIPGAGRPAPPADVQKTVQNQKQITVAMQRLQNLANHADVISKLWDAGRISLSIGADGAFHAALGRLVDLSPEEKQFAADFQSMTEDINLARGPLGATGFRGPEAFGALQAQKGRLAQNPQVFKGVLENILSNFKQLSDSNSAFLKKYASPDLYQPDQTPVAPTVPKSKIHFVPAQ